MMQTKAYRKFPMVLTIFDICFTENGNKDRMSIAALDFKSALAEAERQGVTQALITDIQNTHVTIEGVVLPVTEEPKAIES